MLRGSFILSGQAGQTRLSVMDALVDCLRLPPSGRSSHGSFSRLDASGFWVAGFLLGPHGLTPLLSPLLILGRHSHFHGFQQKSGRILRHQQAPGSAHKALNQCSCLSYSRKGHQLPGSALPAQLQGSSSPKMGTVHSCPSFRCMPSWLSRRGIYYSTP